jgi:hydrogenase/urease accessory protein HupE
MIRRSFFLPLSFRRLSFLLLSFMLVTPFSFGHEGRPLFIELKQLSQGTYELGWRIPPSVSIQNLPVLELVPDCTVHSGDSGMTLAFTGQRIYRCEQPATSLQLMVEYPAANPSLATLVHYQPAGFQPRFIQVGPSESVIDLDGTMATNIFYNYLSLGVKHILSGFDHLLFLICVIWVALGLKRIALAVTGFTIAHSITLGLAALDIVTVPLAPTEALIALSIVFVAGELSRKNADTLAWRYPLLISSVFGLLHGLGFAGVLREVGLPTDDALFALFAFNVGIELGQLLFVASLLSLGWICIHFGGRTIRANLHRLQTFSGYLAGSLAAFWFFQRVVVL